jgi:hypothetical protein
MLQFKEDESIEGNKESLTIIGVGVAGDAREDGGQEQRRHSGSAQSHA